jgi:putative lipoprotein
MTLYFEHNKPCFLVCLLFSIWVTTVRAEAVEISQNITENIPTNSPVEDNTGTRDSWFGKDKLDHFLTSAFVTAYAFAFSEQVLGVSEQASLTIAVGVSLSLGAAKEIRDHRTKKGHASFKDFVANLAGIGCVLLLLKSI